MQDLPRPGSPETKHDLAVAGLGACQPAQQQVDFPRCRGHRRVWNGPLRSSREVKLGRYQLAREVKGARIGPPATERIFLKRKNGNGMGSDYETAAIWEANRVINACDIPVWIYWMADEKIEVNRPSNRRTLAVRSPRAEFAGEKKVWPTGVSIHHGHRVVGMQRNYGASAKISI
jgi:hypothetical protein